MATELRLAALVELGETVAVLAELEHLVAADPTRERPTELLMLALYRAGRQMDALAAYDAHRRELVERTGLEPGPQLRALQRRILTHDPGLCAQAQPPGEQRSDDSRARRPRRTMVGIGLAAAAVAAALLGSLAAGALHRPGRSSEEAALAHELRAERLALNRTESRLRESRRREQALRTQSAKQLHLELQAVHWIERDESADPANTTRMRNDEAAITAVALVGMPYTWGGARPGSGFDCSGLVKWAWGRQGVHLPHNAATQYNVLTHVGGAVDGRGDIHYDHLAIGDLVFFQGFSHVSIYIGRGYMVDAPHTGTVVQILRVERIRALGSHASGAARIAV